MKKARSLSALRNVRRLRNTCRVFLVAVLIVGTWLLLLCVCLGMMHCLCLMPATVDDLRCFTTDIFSWR
ncbi:hypothetical protein SHA53_003119 [Salmonella enterica]|nr:hypothetical protein [Salmonella enterica]